MRLYFLRHGLATRRLWSGPDELRPLTPRGVERMRTEARLLAAMRLRVDVLLTSPLTRARQTAEIVAQELGAAVQEEPRLGLSFDLAALHAILHAYPQARSLLLVGHEPGFSLTIGALIGGGRVVCKKGSLARVDLYSTDPPRGELLWLLPPKALTR